MNDAEPVNINYRYFVHYIKQTQGWEKFKILDFGCGNGEVVKLLRKEKINCYGADVFYDGGNNETVYKTDLFKDKIIRSIPQNGEIPFESGYFDIIISNGVFEHIKDKKTVLVHLKRVLKNDGFMYHHFPSKEVIREEHIGIPFVHWFPKNKLRYAYTFLLRSSGLGYFKGQLSAKDWVKEKLSWLDKYCFYETYPNIYSIFNKEYIIVHREIDYCRFRAKNNFLLIFLFDIDFMKGFYQHLFRRLAFIAVELRKRDSIVQGDIR